MKTNLADVFKRVHGSHERSRKERDRRGKQFKQKYQKMLRNRDDFDSVGIDERTASRKRSGRRPMPKNALPVWKTADPTFGAPSTQSLYCSCFVLVLSVAICMPELVSALGRVDKSWFGSYISYAPQLGVLSNIVLTFFSICCYSRYCMSLSFILSLGTIPIIAAQMGIVSIPAVMSFCCCFPDTCNGDSHSINSAFHMTVHQPNVESSANGTAKACGYLNSIPSKAQCAKENGTLILYWAGVTLMLVSTSFLSSSQYHWRQERVWLNRAKEMIIESRFQDDSSESSDYSSEESSEEEADTRAHKSRRDRKKNPRKKVSFSASTRAGDDLDDLARTDSQHNAEQRKEEVTRLLELAKVKSLRAKKGNTSSRRPHSSRVHGAKKRVEQSRGGRSYTARAAYHDTHPPPGSARQWSSREDQVIRPMESHRAPHAEIGISGTNQFASTRANAHETSYTA